MLKRVFDICAAGAALLVALPVLLVCGLVVALGSEGGALHWSKRVGRYGREFRMPKLRTMRLNAPQLATHLMVDADRWTAPGGRFLRKTSLDELPQLWSVVVGDMSLVGPRPALFNQDDLVALRAAAGVDALRPGLTGWAQVNGRDELSIEEKVRFDAEYLRRRSFAFDLGILWRTVWDVLRSRGVR